ncbi:MAG: hypothetical protein QMC77_08455 [Methanocellales archaeon]|nr:hypothetical protein [Methanocellales archaeon]
MAKREVNPLIWEEVEKFPMEVNVRSFIKDLLLFERRHVSEERPRYSEEYDKLIEKYLKKMEGSESE